MTRLALIGFVLAACGAPRSEPTPLVAADAPCCTVAVPTNAIRNGRLVTLFGQGHYSAGSALVRGADTSGVCPCARAALTFALGADHVIDLASTLPIGEACFPESAAEPMRTDLQRDGRMYGDVIAADFCRDGSDELVLGALSDVGNQLGQGELRLAHGVAGWPDHVLASGLSVFGLAAADLDLDGHLDLIVGSARDATSAAPERKVKGMPSGALDGATAIYYGRHSVEAGSCQVRFERTAHIAEAQGVMSIRVVDGNGDAWPDLLLAGRRVHLVLGSASGMQPPIELSQVEARQIPATQYWYDLDALPLPDGTTLVAASRACFNQGECFKLFGSGVAMGLDTWRITPTATPTLVHRFTAVEGLPGGLRFAELDGASGLELLLGLLVSQKAGCPVLGKYCVGGTPLVARVASLLDDDAPVRLTPLDVGASSPMVGRIEPYLFPRPATCPTQRVCAAATGFATYRGPGVPLGASFHATPCGRTASAALPTSFVPGDRFATTPDATAVSVVWTIDAAPPLLLNNPDDSGGNHMLIP